MFLLGLTVLATAATLWLTAKAIASVRRADAHLRRSPADGGAAMEGLGPFLRRFSLFYSLPLALLVAQLLARATIRRHGSPSLKRLVDGIEFLIPLSPAVCAGLLLLAVGYVSVRAQRAENAATSRVRHRSDFSLAFRLWTVLIALPIAVPLLGLYLLDSRSFWSSLPILLVLLSALVLLSNVLHPYVWLWGVPHRYLQDSSLETGARRLAEDAGFSVQNVFVIDPGLEGLEPGEAGAFTSGLLGSARKVFLSDGLLRQRPTQEVLAVLAHELAHVERGHAWKRAVVLLLLAGAALSITRWAGADGGEGSAEVLDLTWKWAGVLFMLGGFLLYRAYQRATELEADRLAAQRVGADVLASALQPPLGGAEEEAPPGSAVRRILARLFATHPPLQVRLRKLVESARQN